LISGNETRSDLSTPDAGAPVNEATLRLDLPMSCYWRRALIRTGRLTVESGYA
jgi:hypothetical protein